MTIEEAQEHITNIRNLLMEDEYEEITHPRVVAYFHAYLTPDETDMSPCAVQQRKDDEWESTRPHAIEGREWNRRDMEEHIAAAKAKAKQQ